MSLIDDLMRPEAYLLPRPGAVRLATTHISWVLLTDRDAFKVKRPVRFAFLDFSTPALREHFCSEEIRLNTRLAAGVYLGVVPIFLGPTGFTFFGPGEVVDHAVHMRRLDDRDSAAMRLVDGRLSGAHLDHLAQRLASFYATTDAHPEMSMPMHQLVAGNLAEMRALPRGLLARDDLQAVERFASTALDEQSDRLARRQRDGRVRDGHGDLRLEHVYFVGDDETPLVIDALEFNEGFRVADVGLDIAFLSMELEAAGCSALAGWFVSAFARAANDYGFFPLLDLFVAHRAAVRAKVAALVATGAGTPAAKTQRKAAEAGRLLRLARAHAERRRADPWLVCIGGMVGSGKTTVADRLAMETGAVVISSDRTRKFLAGIQPLERARPEHYSHEFSQKTRAEMLARARDVLASRRPVVLDGTFRTRRGRADARDLSRDLGARFLFVEAHCHPETARARLRQREGAASISDAREDVLPRLKAEYEAPDELPGAARLIVDTDAPPEIAVARVREAVERDVSEC
jgi:hypothetical protein